MRIPAALRTLAAAAGVVLAAGALPAQAAVPAAPAPSIQETHPARDSTLVQATSSYLCVGYSACAGAGMPNGGYAAANDQSYWRMSPGHNCTNYVAYRLIQDGMSPVKPWSTTGNAYNWGPANPDTRNLSPVVGAVAWWKAGVKGAGSVGHVAYVQEVVNADQVIVSEDNWGGNFHWKTVNRSSGWPSGFLHFADAGVGSPKGKVDAVTSGSKAHLTLRGWAFDPDLTSRSVHIRAYVGGRPGVGTRYDLDPASLTRKDVASDHPGAGSAHGFEQTISVKKTGTVSVYVYGLNKRGTPGLKTLLGVKKVTVSS